MCVCMCVHLHNVCMYVCAPAGPAWTTRLTWRERIHGEMNLPTQYSILPIPTHPPNTHPPTQYPPIHPIPTYPPNILSTQYPPTHPISYPPNTLSTQYSIHPPIPTYQYPPLHPPIPTHPLMTPQGFRGKRGRYGSRGVPGPQGADGAKGKTGRIGPTVRFHVHTCTYISMYVCAMSLCAGCDWVARTTRRHGTGGRTSEWPNPRRKG